MDKTGAGERARRGTSDDLHAETQKTATRENDNRRTGKKRRIVVKDKQIDS